MKKTLALLLPLFVLSGCTTINNTQTESTGNIETPVVEAQQTSGINEVISSGTNENISSGNEISIKSEDNQSTGENISQRKTKKQFCGKYINIISTRSLMSETKDTVTIKTDAKDTKGYDVFITGKSSENIPIMKEEFQGGKKVAHIDCAPGVCYGIKLNEKTMCSFEREIYTKQPQPKDFGNNDGARYPTIEGYDAIANKIGEMFK